MDKIAELIAYTEEMLTLLDNEESRNWYEWFEKALVELKKSDVDGCKRILSANGGMCSYNDFSLKDYKLEQHREALWDKVFVLASELWKENK